MCVYGKILIMVCLIVIVGFKWLLEIELNIMVGSMILSLYFDVIRSYFLLVSFGLLLLVVFFRNVLVIVLLFSSIRISVLKNLVV